MTKELLELTKKAAEVVKSYPKSTRVRVASHYDADGITSAAILSTALYRLGYNFHATLMRNPFNKGMDKLKAENNELIIFSDMGSALIDAIDEMNCSCIILDHHQYIKPSTSDKVVQINASLCGIDGNYEACGASLCYTFANELDSCNSDLAPLALAGVIGDKQHIGGIKGYNKDILDQTIKNGLLKERTGVKLNEKTIKDALYYSIDPYYKEISGRETEIEKLLTQLKIDPETKIEDIENNKMIKLQSYLLFNLIKSGVQKNILDIVIRTRYYSERLGCELERFADLLDACGKGGHRGIGLSVALGNPQAYKKAEEIEKKYKQKIIESLQILENGGIDELKAMRYFSSDDTSLGGVICGIAANFVADEKKPLFAIGHKKDELHISSRGNQWLVKNGLDLGGALKEITEDIGGYGGGHKIAAGATLDRDKEEIFLKKIDEIITKQIKEIL